jgi:cellulose synthase/poly-beta-1,6-N-acetylglucosamine synthase-like glycosyltransferase
MDKRLAYFQKISADFGDKLDVIIIDDGSTDTSLEEIKAFKSACTDSDFFVASVYPNANKVGALSLAVSAIKHEFVVLSDFDTDIFGLEAIFEALRTLIEDTTLMGCYFRMIPYEGSGDIFLFQQLEYALSRFMYKLHKKDRDVLVMPGAGCCYKRKVLKRIYSEHSGLRSGEDREATLLGIKLGYKAVYVTDILTLTRPPLSFQVLVKQRVRWNLGYLETFFKERDFYFEQIKTFSNTGVRASVDLAAVLLTVLFPILMLVLLILSIKLLGCVLAVIYTCFLAYTLTAVLVSPEETFEFRQKRLYSVLCFPVIKVALECISWIGAVSSFIQKSRAAAKRVAAERATKLPEVGQSVDLEEAGQAYMHGQPEKANAKTSRVSHY